MPKKTKKLEALSQIHAKTQETQITRLDQVWGFNDMHRFGTVDEGEYTAHLRDMTRADLENHAKKVNVIVVEDSGRLRDLLLKEFRSYVISLKKPAYVKPVQGKVSAEAQRVLNEGR